MAVSSEKSVSWSCVKASKSRMCCRDTSSLEVLKAGSEAGHVGSSSSGLAIVPILESLGTCKDHSLVLELPKESIAQCDRNEHLRAL